MAKLQLKAAGFGERVVELKPGINHLGREPESDVHLEHPSVSGTHCEVLVECGRLSVRDCGSSNGTFVDEIPVQNSTLLAGQTLRLGAVELLVADVEASVHIPRFQVPVEAPPVVLANGSILCRRHRATMATYRCQRCRELLCDACIHRLRRRGGKMLCLCPLCSFPVERIGGENKKRKSLIHRLRETTRLLFSRAASKN
jgi:hypothetical protein